MDNATARALARDQSIRALFGDWTNGGTGPSVRNAFPAYRVFLFGFEITEDVTAITCQNHVGKQPNSCTITLLNELDKYLLTVEDMFYLINIDPRSVQMRGRNLNDGSVPDDPMAQRDAALNARLGVGGDMPPILENPQASLDDDFRLSNAMSVKAKVYSLKSAHAKIAADVIDPLGNVKVGSRTYRSRWPFFAGRAIWHPNDPLRVFVRDLFDPTKWYYAFSGLATDIRDDVTKDNQKTLSITAEDPTKLFRYARTTVNPGLTDRDQVLTEQDEQEASMWTSQLADMNLAQIMDRLVFGLHRDTDRFQQLPTGWESFSEEALKLAAIQTGLVQISFAGAKDLIAAEDLNAIIAVMTPREVEQLNAFVERKRAEAANRGTVQSATFDVETINQFGDRLLRRFGVSGVGSFKQARETGREDIPDLIGTAGSFFAWDGNVRNFLGEAPADAPVGTVTRQGFSLNGAPGVDSSRAYLESQAREAIRRALNRTEAATTGPYLFSLGQDPEAPSFTTPITLAEWNNILSWQVRPIDLMDLLNKDVNPDEYRPKLLRRLNSSIITVEDVITVIGSDPLNYPVDGGRLMMLLPIGAGAVGNEVVSQTLVSSFQNRTAQIQNRLTLIYDVLDRLEFVFYCTPKGDLVVEFPLYDFDPEDFSKQHATTYRIEMEDHLSHEATMSDAQVRTQIVVDPAFSNYTDTQEATRSFTRPVVIRRPSMFPTYGVRSESMNLNNLIQSVAAAHIYGNMVLNRMNADAYSVNLPIIPRFEVGLNRPVHWKGRNQMGATMSVVHNMQWNGQWRTTLGLSHSRAWAGQLDSRGNMVFVPIGGSSENPLNYKVLFSRSGAEDEPVTADVNEKEERARLARQQEDRGSGKITQTTFDEDLASIERGT